MPRYQWGYIFLDSVILENLGFGDSRSLEVTALQCLITLCQRVSQSGFAVASEQAPPGALRRCSLAPPQAPLTHIPLLWADR
jgi:hypothetical protein